jgi:hypothetical protein
VITHTTDFLKIPPPRTSGSDGKAPNPGGATLRLLEVAERHLEVILDAVAPNEPDNGR